jgi:hypothetical protein
MSAPGGTASDTAPTGQGLGLLVSAGTTATMTVTLPVTPTYDGLAVTSRTFVITANQIAVIPLPDSVYGIGTTAVQYSNTTSVTVASIRIP